MGNSIPGSKPETSIQSLKEDPNHQVEVDQEEAPLEGKMDRHKVTNTATVKPTSKLDKNALNSDLRNTQIKKRAVAHSEPSTVKKDTINQIRSLALNKEWDGFHSSIKLHIKSEEQLKSVLQALGKVIELPTKTQNNVCNEYSKLCAARKAEILVSDLPEETEEAYGTLKLIITSPENHDSPIGAISRSTSNEFIDQHQLKQANKPLLVFKITERIYDKVVDQLEVFEEQLLASGDQDTAKAIQHSRNERNIETKGRRSLG